MRVLREIAMDDAPGWYQMRRQITSHILTTAQVVLDQPVRQPLKAIFNHYREEVSELNEKIKSRQATTVDV